MASTPELDQDGPLAGVKVVELSMYVQGPVAGLTLASLGADVIKIERADKVDQMRSFRSVFGVTFDDRGREWLFASLNRNKRAVAVDLTSESGREVFHKLIAESDVFITNMREIALERHGADVDTLMAVNPGLIYCRGAGFGMRGPLADDPCQDTVGMAFAGFMDTTAPSDVPNYPPGSMSDILTGTNMASGVMAALLKRARTGKGCVVGTSQTQALLWLQLQGVGIAANLGERMERFSPDKTTNPLFTVYETSDRWIALAALAHHQWEELAKAIGADHLLADERFARFEDLQDNRDAFRPLLADHLRTNTTGHWWQAIRGSSVWVAPVNQLEDLIDDEHVLANEYLVTYDDGFVGPPTPFEVDGHRGERGPAAEYGEHTDEVLAELGYDDGRILELKADGTIW